MQGSQPASTRSTGSRQEAREALLRSARCVTRGYNSPPKATYLPPAFVHRALLMLTCNYKGTRPTEPNTQPGGLRSPNHAGTPRTAGLAATNTSSNSFPFNNFTYCLTLFSKFFSSFPHGTCSLSVSRRYLALDEVYHPLRTALPSNPTL